MRSSPRILYFSTPWAYYSIRSLHVARALQQLGKVEVVVVNCEGGDGKSVTCLGTEFKVAFELSVQPCTPRPMSGRLRSAVDPRVQYPHGLRVDDAGNCRAVTAAREFDLVWFFKLRTANMFATWNWRRSLLDVDDLPSGVHQTLCRSGAILKDRLAAAIQVLIWKRRERLLGKRFGALAVCSEADKRSLSVEAPVHVIPNGFERPREEPARKLVVPPRIGFIGLFEYFANLQGVQWFADKCWPLIKREVSGVRLRLVGRGSQGLTGLGSDVDALGWLENVAEEIATWSAMIVPVRFGGGTRVKIAEGFSRKCPVVSTRLGAFGYDVHHTRELLLADDAAGFAAACVSLLKDPAAASAMAERAFASFLKHWTWDAIAPRVWAAAEDAMRSAECGVRSAE
jgi:glycosyltransferase involved in cell wall biosynthesis